MNRSRSSSAPIMASPQPGSKANPVPQEMQARQPALPSPVTSTLQTGLPAQLLKTVPVHAVRFMTKSDLKITFVDGWQFADLLESATDTYGTRHALVDLASSCPSPRHH